MSDDDSEQLASDGAMAILRANRKVIFDSGVVIGQLKAKLASTTEELARVVRERDEAKKQLPSNMAEWCYCEDRWNDRLFDEINRTMGQPDLSKCNEPGFKWACSDTWVDSYDGSVEIIRGPQWPELTEAQAMAILDLGFGQIYESPANADTDTRTGFNWTRNGRSWCYPKNRGDDNVRMVKAIISRDALTVAARQAEVALAAMAWMRASHPHLWPPIAVTALAALRAVLPEKGEV